MNKKAILLSLTEYDFVNENTGERVSGATVHIVGDRLEEKGQYGHRVAKFKASPDIVKKIKSVPCVVECVYDLKISSKNEPSLVLKDLNYVSDYTLDFK